MLKYFISVTENLIVPAVLLGMLTAYVRSVYGSRGIRILTAGAIIGFIGAAVMSYLKNKTRLINTTDWNFRIFTLFIGAYLLFLLFDLPLIRKKTGGERGVIVPVLSALLAGAMLVYSLPDVLAYPYTFVLGGQAVFSTGFIYRFIGMILGLLLVILSAFAVNYTARRLNTGTVGLLLKLALLVTAIQYASKIAQTLITRRIISNHTLFLVVKYTSNHSYLFIFGVLAAAAVIPVALWIMSFFVNEPYRNPAEHRKILAKWRSSRRWSTVVILCFILAVLNITVIKAYANRPVELSPTEECEVRDDKVYVPLEQVDDGHLHRFDYETPNKVKVRFIVIKKPNSSAYGVGLDACDICGETGYFERNGQIVCKLCDVVMNINTIGFKGGCNPKVIDYSIKDGYIIVPTYTLIEHEKDFK